MGRGILIAIEGANRLYKHQLAYMLRKTLMEQIRKEVKIIKTPEGPLINNFLGGWENVPDKVIYAMYSTNHWAQSLHVKETLNEGNIIILQRYVASNQAYALARGAVTSEWCKALDSGLPKPDITIYVERDLFEHLNSDWSFPDIYENPDTQLKVINQYNQIKEDNWVTINTSQLNPRQALEQSLSVVLRELENCNKNNNDLQFY